MSTIFNTRLKQIILLGLIILLAILLLNQLDTFMPGFLGAITLYILFRERYFKRTIKNKKNKTWTAVMYIIISIIVIAIPIYFAAQLIADKAGTWLSNPEELMNQAKLVDEKLYNLTNFHVLSDGNMKTLQQKATALIPKLLNSSANLLTNFAIMFFILYYLLINGWETEKFLNKFIPLKDENVVLLGNETKNMIKANAIGIPVLAVIQGFVGIVGYWIFGVQDALLWGFATAFFSMVPIVGTAIVWLPLSLYLFATDKTGNGIGLLIYSAVILTNVDYVARLTLLKKFMDVHPLVTILGVIIGVGMFGFWGVIFGPLLISYFIILVKIYINEFGTRKTPSVDKQAK